MAIKTQYLLLALIALSLLSIVPGSPERPEAALLAPADDAPPAAMLFAVFFPAVTASPRA